MYVIGINIHKLVGILKLLANFIFRQYKQMSTLRFSLKERFE